MKRTPLSYSPALLTGPRAVALTLAATATAALLSVLMAPMTHVFPFSFFFLAVALSAWFGGFSQGLLAMVLAPFLVNYFVLPLSSDPRSLLRAVLWFVIAGSIAFMVGRLRGVQARAQTVLANIGEGVVILDRDWNVVYINESGAPCATLSPREMIGRNYWEVAPEAGGTAFEQQLRQCAAERVPVQFETRTPRRQRWLQVRAYPLPEGMCFFSHDITEAKEREAKLRAILDRLTTAHKAAQIGTFEWSVNTNQITFSDQALRNHGWTAEQWDGRFETWARTLHREDSPAVLAKIRKALEEKSEYYAEFRALWPNGEIHWLVGHGQVIVDEHGNATGIIGICFDITHRHEEEEALRRSEKLAAAGRLAATIAHEINNPLEAVTNLVYLMRRDLGVNSETQDMLRLADEQLARVNHIAKQTLGFYQDRNVPEAVDVVQTLEELLSILQSRINARQIEVAREYENACLLHGFRGELRQVLSNLLTNAIDASPSGGRLILRVHPERDGNQVARMRVEIEDFGPGIPPSDQERIFEPFFTTKSDVGTGLGLWVTKGLVEKNGGAISFRSNCQPGAGASGTCFSVTLPASESDAQASAVAS